MDTAPAAVATTPVSAGAIPSSSSTSAASTTPTVVAADAVPEVGVEEVVLNRRGMVCYQWFNFSGVINSGAPRSVKVRGCI